MMSTPFSLGVDTYCVPETSEIFLSSSLFNLYKPYKLPWKPFKPFMVYGTLSLSGFMHPIFKLSKA